MSATYISLFWGGATISDQNGYGYDPPNPKGFVYRSDVISFSELLDAVCEQTGFLKEIYSVTMYYRMPVVAGPKATYLPLLLKDDKAVELMYMAAAGASHTILEVFVDAVPITYTASQMPYTVGWGSVPEHAFASSSRPQVIPSGRSRVKGPEAGQSTRPAMRGEVGGSARGAARAGSRMILGGRTGSCSRGYDEGGFDEDWDFESGGDHEQEIVHEHATSPGDDLEDDALDSADEGDDASVESDPVSSDSDVDSTAEETGADESELVNYGGMMFGDAAATQRVLRFHSTFEEEPTVIDDGQSSIGFPTYDPTTRQIALMMLFQSKEEVKEAISNWGIYVANREHKVYESRGKAWAAKCNAREPCAWQVRARLKTPLKMWQITVWQAAHTCSGAGRSSGHTNLTSKMIGAHIRHLVEDNPLLQMATVLKSVKETFGLDMSYKKAWHARLKAIDMVYGTWPESFAKLPAYLKELQRANPGTVVEWVFRSDSYGLTERVFKYVFWSFLPSIDASYSCRPVVSVDGTFLKGSYKGKLLVAVCHDANNSILPLAYAVVDEETTESWSWFMTCLRERVLSDRPHMCIISDRHHGLRNAMKNLEDWQEPFGYHRYCLRHIKSNYASNFTVGATEKNLVWQIGSSRNRTKADKLMEELKTANGRGYDYLHRGLTMEQWCLAYDGDVRWGILTTNISESHNNVLRSVRHLPITAMINGTLIKTVHRFATVGKKALATRERLPPLVWKSFRQLETVAMGHHVRIFDRRFQVYEVTTKLDTRIGKGGNVVTVQYRLRRCSCGKWQMFRRACSHAIAVCRAVCGDPVDLYNEVYTTATWRNQYTSGFTPIRDESLWIPKP